MRLRAAVALLLAAAAFGCAHRGYFLDEPTRRIYAKDSWGRISTWYEPGTPEYRKIALQFWPELAGETRSGRPNSGRRGRLNRLMHGLDQDQWHILLDLEMWTGKDEEDLARLEDLEAMAHAVKGLSFDHYLELKRRYSLAWELRKHLLEGDR
ncbi:MAG: hypothetical protein NTX64_12335 [Elusimicrobia bacterium]|nr:hypothetical protein [Elusimicrobiota bacterium]